MQYNKNNNNNKKKKKKCMNLWWVLNKIFFVCIAKTQVDKVMASTKKGVKYMVIISSNTKFLFDTSHNWVI